MGVMTDEKVLTILRLTIERTNGKQLHWQVSENDDAIFISKTASGSELRMYPHTDYDSGSGEGPPSLTLYDASGKMIVDITQGMDGVDLETLENLYEMVRRIAQGVDEKLDAILSDLTNEADIPF
jgi:hypothetical protein